MNQRKLEVVKHEIDRLNIDILGISELKWTGIGHFQSDKYRVFYAGNDRIRRNGVFIILKVDIEKIVLSYNAKTDRIISIKLKGNPVNATIIQAYVPTANTEEDKLDSFYNDIQEEIDRAPKQELLMVIGDWNPKMGSIEKLRIVEIYGLETRNEAGERLIEFSESNGLFIVNTFCKVPKRRLYTWTPSDGQYRNQIDYIIGNRRERSPILAITTRLGANCGTDHKLLSSKIRLTLKKDTTAIAVPKYDINNIPEEFKSRMKNRYEILSFIDGEPEEIWTKVKNIITEEAEKTVLKLKKGKKPQWMSIKTLKTAQDID